MRATSDEVYKQINNDLYNEQGDTWWDENQFLYLLKSSVNLLPKTPRSGA
jgi:hypothetical protein